MEALTRDLQTTYRRVYPNMAKLLAIAMTVPMTSVACERAFSKQNRIKSQFRSRLSAKNFENLMMVASCDIPLEVFDFEKAITMWKQ